MAYYEIRDWSRGIDFRRLPETTRAGALMSAINCHITRGGELEKRKAIAELLDIPAGTQGLWVEDGPKLHVWSTLDAPGELDARLVWHKIQHPTDAAVKIHRVLCVDDFESIPYAVIEFKDGTVAHYYQDLYVDPAGEKVDTSHVPPKFGNGRATTEWFELRPNAVAFPVASVTDVWLMPPGTATTPASWIRLNNASVPYATSGQAWARALASNVNTNVSTPDVYCEALDNQVRFSMKDQGDQYNGYQIQIVISGQAAAVPQTTQTLTGGQRTTALTFPPRLPQGTYDYTLRALYRVDAGTPKLLLRYPSLYGRPGVNDWLEVNGNHYRVTAKPTQSALEPGWWEVTLDPAVTATGYVDGTIYTALGRYWDIAFWAFGLSWNFTGPGITPASDIPIETEPPDLPPLAGEDPDQPEEPGPYIWSPGRFAMAFGGKVYATSGSALNFSAIGNARQWSPDYAGAGFIDTSNFSSGNKNLTAVCEYGTGQLAVFAKRDIQLWAVDPDPGKNALRQPLRNTGTKAPRSVVPWANDLIYLDSPGIRTLRARELSNAAWMADIGNPIDSLVQATVFAAGEDLASRAVGVVDPLDGRLIMAIGNTMFVYSYFPQSKIAAWTIYRPGFRVEEMAANSDRVYCRSGDKVYVLGGESGQEYDDCEVYVELPYLDMDDPGTWKLFGGIDIAARGTWSVKAALVTQDHTAEIDVAEIENSTFDIYRVGAIGEASHISMRFTNEEDGPAVLGPVLIHYQKTEAL